MPAFLKNHVTLSHKPFEHAPLDRAQGKPMPEDKRCHPLHDIAKPLGNCYVRNREANIESVKSPHPNSIALSPSDQALPSSSTPFALPTFSFSPERILPRTASYCEATSSSGRNCMQWSNVRIRSVTHPNSPYVPWSEFQRQWIFSSAETLGDEEAPGSDSYKEPVKRSFTVLMPHPPRLGSLETIAKYFRSLYYSSRRHLSPMIRAEKYPAGRCNDSTATVSSVQSHSLENWLAERQREMSPEENFGDGKPYNSLDDCEQGGSWIHPQNPPQSYTFDFSLDCVPSPSPTIISFSCASL